MSTERQPERDPDPRLDTETPVDQDEVDATVGCDAFHRKRDDDMQRSGTFIASDVANLVDAVLVKCEEYHVAYRVSIIEEVIAGLREEMEK
jgi:hypothetical protein